MSINICLLLISVGVSGSYLLISVSLLGCNREELRVYRPSHLRED